jgi:hypothetical protein
MNKVSEINYDTVAGYGVKGLAGGIGIGGIMELIRQYNAEREDAKRKKMRETTSGDTIVITLPKSPTGEKLAETLSKMAFTPAELEARNKVTGYTGELPPKAPTGSKDPWSAETYALAGGAGLAGLYGGYKLMSALGEKYREHMLKRKVEAAKKHHMEAVMGLMEDKTAEMQYIEDLFNYESVMKLAQAAGNQMPGTVNKEAPAPGAGTIGLGTLYLLALLGTGGMAYGTKKVLDDRARLIDKEEDESMNKPRVSRILLKSAKYGDTELDPVDTQVALALSVLAHKRNPGYLKKANIRKEAAKLSLTPDMVVNKLNNDDIADTVVMFKKASGLWAELRKPFEKQAGLSLASFLAGAAGDDYLDVNKVYKKDNTDEIADKVVEKIEARKLVPVQPKEVAGEIDIEAQGPQAKKYLESNRQRLAKVVKAMAHNGTL